MGVRVINTTLFIGEYNRFYETSIMWGCISKWTFFADYWGIAVYRLDKVLIYWKHFYFTIHLISLFGIFFHSNYVSTVIAKLLFQLNWGNLGCYWYLIIIVSRCSIGVSTVCVLEFDNGKDKGKIVPIWGTTD